MALHLFICISVGVSSKNTKNTYDDNSISWCYFVRQMSIAKKRESSWHFSSGDKFRCLLKFKRLLIDVLTLVSKNLIAVQLTLLLVWTRISSIITFSWKLNGAVALSSLHSFFMATVGALVCDDCCLNLSSCSVSNNTWNHN